MTNEEFMAATKAIAEQRRKADRDAIERYENDIKAAAERLNMAKQMARIVQAAQIKQVPEVDEINHESRVRSNAHDFKRYMKKMAMNFEADRREFEYDGEQIAADVVTHFDIEADVVTFTTTVKMKRITHK